jgi:hypothetical protein
MTRAWDLVRTCPCDEGCPACVGPAGENAAGGKPETLAILEALAGSPGPECGSEDRGLEESEGMALL